MNTCTCFSLLLSSFAAKTSKKSNLPCAICLSVCGCVGLGIWLLYFHRTPCISFTISYHQLHAIRPKRGPKNWASHWANEMAGKKRAKNILDAKTASFWSLFKYTYNIYCIGFNVCKCNVPKIIYLHYTLKINTNSLYYLIQTLLPLILGKLHRYVTNFEKFSMLSYELSKILV